MPTLDTVSHEQSHRHGRENRRDHGERFSTWPERKSQGRIPRTRFTALRDKVAVQFHLDHDRWPDEQEMFLLDATHDDAEIEFAKEERRNT